MISTTRQEMTSDELKDLYNNFRHCPSLDHLTNAEYITHLSEPRYAVVLSLIKTVSFDIIRYILQYTKSEKDTNLTERTLRRLTRSIIHGDVVTFGHIYSTEYMVPNIINWFEYDYDNDSLWGFEPVCDCPQTNLIHINRHTYIRPCTCAVGKRYLAHLLVREEGFDNAQSQQMIDYITQSEL